MTGERSSVPASLVPQIDSREWRTIPLCPGIALRLPPTLSTEFQLPSPELRYDGEVRLVHLWQAREGSELQRVAVWIDGEGDFAVMSYQDAMEPQLLEWSEHELAFPGLPVRIASWRVVTIEKVHYHLSAYCGIGDAAWMVLAMEASTPEGQEEALAILHSLHRTG